MGASGHDGRGVTRPRLVDVAARAGVSSATASLVLRDRPGPSAQTRAAVRAAAAELGYRPDRTASLLARRRSHLLGVLLDVSSPFHAEMVAVLDAAAGDRGLDLVLSTVTPRRDERRALETLLDFRCEGVLLLGSRMPRADLDELAGQCPAVLIGRSGVGRVPGVLASDEQGLDLVVEHLVSFGHRRIAYLDGPRGSIATSRRKGYRRAMTRRGLGEHIEVLAGGQTEQEGRAAAADLMGRRPGVRPTAVAAFNDRCAIGLLDGLRRSGVGVPQLVSVVGYDDSPIARLGTVELTSVSQDPHGLAEAGISLMAQLLDGAESFEPQDVSDVVITPRLTVRTSTGPVPGRT